jgi:hypothetical protein
MALTPKLQDITLKASSTAYAIFISNITTTTFQINTDTAPTGGITFGWNCKLY